MKSLVLAQQSSLTFDQFKWVWVAAFSVFGLLLIIGGLVVSRRTRVGRMEARQKLMGFIRSGVLWEEDITQALNAPHLSPAPPDLTPQMWLDRILDGSPLIEQLLLNWQRPWGASSPG